jgi:hypothetical protein
MGKITLLATGDFAFTNRTVDLALNNQLDKLFNDFIPEINCVDLAITNLELPLTTESKPISKTGPALKADPRCINTLKLAGFGLVTLANNHILDYGEQGLKETIELCNLNKIATVGAGESNLIARKPFLIEKSGIKITILSFAENEWSTTYDENYGAAPMDICDNFYDIKNAKKTSDFVIVIVHGGHETYNLPSPRMKKQYRFYIDSGADVVIGHHTHCFSGMEIYNSKYIFYSIGNFIFDLNKKTEQWWNEGFAVNLSFEKKMISYKLIPYIQNDNNVGIRCMNELETVSFFNKFQTLSDQIKDDNVLEMRFNEFAEKKKKMYNAYIQPYKNRYLQYLYSKGILPNFWKGKSKLLLYNLIRCESHRDILLKNLKP